MTVRALSERVTTRGRVDSHAASPRSESVLTVSWDDEYGRLNLIVLGLALVAVAGHYAPPWFGLA